MTELLPWPTCPECGARRTTTCPVCHTSGTDFPQADSEFLGSPGLDPRATAMSCGCGSGGCSSHESDTCEESPPGQPDAEDAQPTDQGEAPDRGDEAEAAPARSGPVVMCSLCDEPFSPEYPRRCEWCGHEFPDGSDIDLAAGEPPEELTTRAMIVMFALGLLAVVMLAYFFFLMPR